MNDHRTIKILLISRNKSALSELKSGLGKKQVQTEWVESGSIALARIAQENFDLAVADENLADMTGLEFCEEVIAQNPMVNLAAVSTLSPADFHETSEGMGILMQLPVSPTQKHAEKLLNQLSTILGLAERIEFKINE
jgi:CheY-like chemotaxis protein